VTVFCIIYFAIEYITYWFVYNVKHTTLNELYYSAVSNIHKTCIKQNNDTYRTG